MARKPPKKMRRYKVPAAPGPRGPHAQPVAATHAPDPRVVKAQAYWNHGRYDEAIWYYEQALARDPHNPELLVDVARAYALRYRYADAERLVKLAESLYPDDANLQQMLGRSYVMLKQFDRAIGCYGRFLQLQPASTDRPAILLELAKMHERLHDLDAARERAEEALRLAPNFEKAKYTLATIERRAGNTAGALARWRELVEASQAPPGVIADAWYQLAAACDNAGRYDEAFDCLAKAKQIFEHASSPHRHDASIIARTASGVSVRSAGRRTTIPSLGPVITALRTCRAALTS